jgi:hypothetical protein
MLSNVNWLRPFAYCGQDEAPAFDMIMSRCADVIRLLFDVAGH